MSPRSSVRYCDQPADVIRSDVLNDPKPPRNFIKEYIKLNSSNDKLKIDVEFWTNEHSNTARIYAWSPVNKEWHEVVNIESAKLPRYDTKEFMFPKMDASKRATVVKTDMEKIKKELIGNACKILF